MHTDDDILSGTRTLVNYFTSAGDTTSSLSLLAIETTIIIVALLPPRLWKLRTVLTYWNL